MERKRKMKVAFDFQVHKLAITKRQRRLALKAFPKHQHMPNSSVSEKRMQMTLEQKRERRKQLRAQTGIFPKEEHERTPR